MLGEDLKFIRYYKNLENIYVLPSDCERTLRQTFNEGIKRKIISKAEEDEESRLGVYLKGNPLLCAPSENMMTTENERILVTRYRCGSHSLKIETGRLCNPKIPRENRLCECSTGVQTLWHCLKECPLLMHLYDEFHYASIEDALNADNIVIFITKMEKILKIST